MNLAVQIWKYLHYLLDKVQMQNDIQGPSLTSPY